jgi:hypothetical protein
LLERAPLRRALTRPFTLSPSPRPIQVVTQMPAGKAK